MWDLLFTGQAVWFSVPALVGTGLFLLKFVLMLAGGDHHGGFDAHDADGLDHGADGHDGDADLKLLSVQGVLAFLMGFGWTGLLVLSSTRAQLIVALAVALAVGTAAMYAMARAMAAMMKLQASGNVDVKAAVGTMGTVYVGIPGDGRGMGQVTLVIGDKQRTYNAVSSGGELVRNAKVRVVGIQGQNTLSVEPA
jgi:membrane protein implicated in regulation of membrane protease activity